MNLLFSPYPIIVNGCFFYYFQRAGLSKDRLSIRTGQDDLEEMGQVFSMNNITQFKAWSTDECNNVSGSDGLFFKRTDVKNKKEIYLFHKDSCRSLALEYDSRVDVSISERSFIRKFGIGGELFAVVNY